MSRPWKEIAEGWRPFARRAEKGTCRLVAPPREEKPWDCWGELESPSKDAVCVLGVEGLSWRGREEGGGESGAREGRGCPLPAKLPRAAAGAGGWGVGKW